MIFLIRNNQIGGFLLFNFKALKFKTKNLYDNKLRK
jgi:hypothetical protein